MFFDKTMETIAATFFFNIENKTFTLKTDQFFFFKARCLHLTLEVIKTAGCPFVLWEKCIKNKPTYLGQIFYFIESSGKFNLHIGSAMFYFPMTIQELFFSKILIFQRVPFWQRIYIYIYIIFYRSIVTLLRLMWRSDYCFRSSIHEGCRVDHPVKSRTVKTALFNHIVYFSVVCLLSE